MDFANLLEVGKVGGRLIHTINDIIVESVSALLLISWYLAL